ncbi:MAG: hypothetical protein Q8N22_02055 [bacterium]|nr:hypothetical protein [bacterium]
MRKILAIIIGVVGVLALGWVIYYFISRAASPIITAKPETESTSAQQAASQLKIVSQEPVFDYWTASTSQEIFYITPEGKIAKIGAPQNTYLSEQTITNLNFALPSPDSQKVIAAFGDSRQPQFSIFDLASSTWSPLPLEIKSVAWSPEGKRLAAIINQNNQTDLIILDLAKYLSSDPKQKAKSSTTIVKNFSLQDLKMNWLIPDEIIFTGKPSNSVMGSAWRLNFAKPTKTTFTEIVPPGTGLMIKWLKEDSGLKFQNQKSSLINWTGQTINNFSIMVLPDKCVLKSDSLYCFLFTSANPKINWPDDYLQKSIYTIDALYKFNLNNLVAPELIFAPTEGKIIDASDLKILGDQILFINRYDNQLYSLEVE